MSSESVSIRTRLISDIEGLTAIARPPASPGERQAAEWLASRFDEINLPEEIEVFRFNADYWMVWASHGLLSAVAAAIAFAGSEAASAASLLGAVTTASFWGELTARFGLLRRLFPRRESFNVLARLRNPGAPRVLIFGAHHDAARSGPVFHPRLVAFGKGWPPPFRIPFAAMLAVTLLTLVIAVASTQRLAPRSAACGGCS